MTQVIYQYLAPGQATPVSLTTLPFKVVIIAEAQVEAAWRDQIGHWLVDSGCLYAMSWGDDCGGWEDALDYARQLAFGNSDIPDDLFTMTTCHRGETLAETFWFAGFAAFHPTVELTQTVVLHISEKARPTLLAEFEAAQVLPDHDSTS